MHSGKDVGNLTKRLPSAPTVEGPSTAITCPSPTRSLILELVEAKRAGPRDLKNIGTLRPESLRG